MFAILPVYSRSELLQESSYRPGADGVSATLVRVMRRGLQPGTLFSSTPARLTSFTPEYSIMILKALKPAAGAGLVITSMLNASSVTPTHLPVQGLPIADVLGKNWSAMPGPVSASTVAGSELS